MRQMAGALARNVRTPLGLPGAVRAIIASGDYTPKLEAMREHSVPTIVVHGENDLVVPFESALDVAERTDGALYRVPGAYHSWMLANPRHGADMVRQLLAAELGDALRDTARAHGIVGVPGGWQTLLTPTHPCMRWSKRSWRPSASSRSNTSKWTGCAWCTPCATPSTVNVVDVGCCVAPQTCGNVNWWNRRYRLVRGGHLATIWPRGRGARSRRGITRWTARCRTSR